MHTHTCARAHALCVCECTKFTSKCVCSPAGAKTTKLGVVARISLRSRKNAPKNGTTLHSGIAKARLRARSYSTDNRAVERESNTGSDSFSVIDNQNGFNLLDLFTVRKNIYNRK